MTRAGWVTLVGAIVLYAAGALLGHREALVLGVAGVALVIVGLAVAAGRPRIEVERRIAPDRVSVGDLAEGFVTVTNVGRGRSPALSCRDVVGTGAVEVAVPRLGAGRALTLPYPLPTGRRAVVRVGPMLVARGDAFGLVERRTTHGGQLLLHVHPRVHPLGPLSVGRRRDIEGPTSETERGAMVFHALREYVIGDDLRRVHWKATAHTGQLMVREHVDPSRPGATVVLDDRRPSMDPARFELAVEAVASVTVSSLRRGFPVRVLTYSDQLASDGSGTVERAGSTSGTAGPNGGEGALLDVLAGVDQRDAAGHDRLLGLLATGRGGRALVLVTGAPSAEELTAIGVAGRRFDTVLVLAVTDGPVPASVAGSATVVRVTDAEQLVAAWAGLR